MAVNTSTPVINELKDREEDAMSINGIVPTYDSKKSTWELLSQYKAAIFWSAFMGLAAINWGMDVLVRLSALTVKGNFVLTAFQLSNGVISVPSFQKDFGYMFQNEYIISASWQIAFNTAASIGGFFGAIGSGYLADRMGKKLSLAVGCIVSIGAVFIQIFAGQPGTLMAGKVRLTIPLIISH